MKIKCSRGKRVVVPKCGTLVVYTCVYVCVCSVCVCVCVCVCV